MLEEGVTNGVHKGKVIQVDYAAIGAAYGCKTHTKTLTTPIKTLDEHEGCNRGFQEADRKFARKAEDHLIAGHY